MMAEMTIKCRYCNHIFNASSDAACIILHPNLGCSRFQITIDCPNCGKKLSVPETQEAHKWLDNRIKNRKFTVAKQTAIEEAVFEAITERGA